MTCDQLASCCFAPSCLLPVTRSWHAGADHQPADKWHHCWVEHQLAQQFALHPERLQCGAIQHGEHRVHGLQPAVLGLPDNVAGSDRSSHCHADSYRHAWRLHNHVDMQVGFSWPLHITSCSVQVWVCPQLYVCSNCMHRSYKSKLDSVLLLVVITTSHGTNTFSKIRFGTLTHVFTLRGLLHM